VCEVLKKIKLLFTTAPRNTKTSPRKRRLFNCMRRKLSYYRHRLTMSRRLSTADQEKRANMSVEDVIRGASKFLKGVPLAFISSQLRMAGQKPRARRWTAADKLLALSVYHRSPAAYRFLAKQFTLPTRSSLQRWLSGMNFEPGVCDSVISCLRSKVKTMSSTDRLSVLCIDEMAIKASLDYDSGRDVVDGFEDYGDCRSGRIASEALVFMVKGICRKWKQPLCYFLSAGPTTSDKLRELVLNVLDSLREVGLVVKAVVCDQGANNRSLFTKLGVSVDKPFIEVNQNKVYFLHDPPHLLKSVRNNFRKYNVKFSGGVAKWEHVKKFYDCDSKQKVRLACKLKQVHVTLNNFKTMNVRLAAQIMSHTVASGLCLYAGLPGDLMPPEAVVAAEFIEYTDKLFDSCNAVNFRDVKVQRRPVTAKSYHVKFWQESINWLKNVQFLGARGAIYCVEGWRLTLSALLCLWQELETDLKFFSTRRLNQDCLESYFSSIRQKCGCRDNPSASHFRSAMRQCVANSLLVSTDGGNCDGDDDSVILSLQALCSKHNSKRTLEQSQRSVLTVASRSLSAPNHFPAVERSLTTSATSFVAESSLSSSCCAPLSDNPSALVVPCSLDKFPSRSVLQRANCLAVTDESFNMSPICQSQTYQLPCLSVSACTRTERPAASFRRPVVLPRLSFPLPVLKPTTYTSQTTQSCTQSATICSRPRLVSRVSVSVPRLTTLSCIARPSQSSVLPSAVCPRRVFIARSSVCLPVLKPLTCTGQTVRSSIQLFSVTCCLFSALTSLFSFCCAVNCNLDCTACASSCTQPTTFRPKAPSPLSSFSLPLPSPVTCSALPTKSSVRCPGLCSDAAQAVPSLPLIRKYRDLRARRFQMRNIAKNSNHLALENAMTYVAGYVARKIVVKHECDKCSDALCKAGDLMDSKLIFMHLKAFCSGDFGSLKVPSDELVKLLFKVEEIFLLNFSFVMFERALLQALVGNLQTSVSSNLAGILCPGIVNSIFVVYLHIRIPSELKAVMADVKQSKIAAKSKINRKLLKLQHV
jgi:hypothetical protein